MSDKAQSQRDRIITRFIHRLFFRAITRSKGWFTLSILLNAPGFFIFHVLIPLQIAYGIQSIITRNFYEIRGHIITLLVLALVHTIVFSAGNLSINRCGAIACGYVQRQVFANFLEKDYDFYSDSYVGALGAQAARLRDAAFEYHHLLFFEVPKQLAIVVAGILVIGLQSVQLALLTFGCML
ncbi:MAG TPA: hypothetical protein VM187_12400, partial [Niastella sp.]|nr:hypothetical protein [Niastella sp.]